jgi:hypothetical protein
VAIGLLWAPCAGPILGLVQASLARLTLADTKALEQILMVKVPNASPAGASTAAASLLPVLGTLPRFPTGPCG